jgi:hypothetical protein
LKTKAQGCIAKARRDLSHPINGVETWIFSVLLFMVERVASDPLLLQGASEVTVMMSALGKHFVSHCRMTSSDSWKRELLFHALRSRESIASM